MRRWNGVDLEEDFAAFVSDCDLKVRDFRRIGVRDKFHGGHGSFGASRWGVWQVLAVGVLFGQAVATEVEIIPRQGGKK